MMMHCAASVGEANDSRSGLEKFLNDFRSTDASFDSAIPVSRLGFTGFRRRRR
jgi:hypothetical protein